MLAVYTTHTFVVLNLMEVGQQKQLYFTYMTTGDGLGLIESVKCGLGRIFANCTHGHVCRRPFVPSATANCP